MNAPVVASVMTAVPFVPLVAIEYVRARPLGSVAWRVPGVAVSSTTESEPLLAEGFFTGAAATPARIAVPGSERDNDGLPGASKSAATISRYAARGREFG